MSKSNRKTTLSFLPLDALAARWANTTMLVSKDSLTPPKTIRPADKVPDSDDPEKAILNTYIQDVSETNNRIAFKLFGVKITTRKHIFRLLCCLIEAQGNVVERQALAKRLRYTSIYNVTGVVLQLRRMLAGCFRLTSEESMEVVPVTKKIGYRIDLTLLEQFGKRRT